MNKVDQEYFRLVNTILEKGRIKKNRTGIDTIGVFGEQAKFDLYPKFPILTTKRVWFKGIVHELLWFIKGDTNIKYLVDNDVHIWDEWAFQNYLKDPNKSPANRNSDGTPFEQSLFINIIKTCNPLDPFVLKYGELGEGTYGGMWRGFPYASEGNRVEFDSDGEKCYGLGRIDQLQKVIDKLKTNPDDRRMIVSAWHPYWVDRCALPPCHCFMQFNTEELTEEERTDILTQQYGKDFVKGLFSVSFAYDKTINQILDEHNIPKRRLNCLMLIRSNDFFLGCPYNISSYSLLTCLLGQCVNMIPGTLTYTIGDAHIYSNHLDQIKLQMSREPKELPTLWLNPDIKDLFQFKYDDIKLIGYDPHPTIKGEVAV